MKRRNTIHRILVILFCIAVVSTGMYAPHMGTASCFSCVDPSNTLSAATRHDKVVDSADKTFGIISDEFKLNLSSSKRNKLTYRNCSLKYMLLMVMLPLIPLITWAMHNLLLLNKLIDRMFLILFIHNSDGKKGDSTGIFMTL